LIKKGAQALSLVMHPIFLAYYGIVAAVHWHFVLSAKLGGQTESFFLLIFFLSLVAVPMLGLMLLLRKYSPKELAHLTPEERLISLMVMSVLYFFMAFSFDTLFVDPILKYYVISLGISSLVGFFLSKFTRISMHLLGCGALTAFIILLARNASHPIDWLLFVVLILSGFVGVSRLYLKAHRASEIYLGYSTGLILNIIYYIIVYGFQMH